MSGDVCPIQRSSLPLNTALAPVAALSFLIFSSHGNCGITHGFCLVFFFGPLRIYADAVVSAIHLQWMLPCHSGFAATGRNVAPFSPCLNDGIYPPLLNVDAPLNWFLTSLTRSPPPTSLKSTAVRSSSVEWRLNINIFSGYLVVFHNVIQRRIWVFISHPWRKGQTKKIHQKRGKIKQIMCNCKIQD